MAENYEVIKGFQTDQGLGRYDYEFLHGKPGLATQEKAGLLSPEDKKKIDEFSGSGGGGTSGDIEFPVTSVNGKTGEVQLTKEDFGLDKVENKSSEEIRNEITKDDVTSALGYTPPTPEEVGNVDLSDYPTKEEVNKQFEEFKVEVDPTLSIEGTAADAKAVGEVINQLALGVAYIDEEDNEIITLNYPSAEGVGF